MSNLSLHNGAFLYQNMLEQTSNQANLLGYMEAGPMSYYQGYQPHQMHETF